MLLREFITLAADIELAVASIYDHFAQQFSEHVEFSTFWRLSAEAERYHAATIRIHEATAAPDQVVDDDQLPIEVSQARKLLGQLQQTQAELVSNPRTPDQAIELALEIESEGAEVHGRSQFAFLYPDLEDLFSRLAEEDRAHRKSFALAKAKFGSLEA
jgi:rubrerythrin